MEYCFNCKKNVNTYNELTTEPDKSMLETTSISCENCSNFIRSYSQLKFGDQDGCTLSLQNAYFSEEEKAKIKELTEEEYYNQDILEDE